MKVVVRVSGVRGNRSFDVLRREDLSPYLSEFCLMYLQSLLLEHRTQDFQVTLGFVHDTSMPDIFDHFDLEKV